MKLYFQFIQNDSVTGALIVAGACRGGVRMNAMGFDVRFAVQLEQGPVGGVSVRAPGFWAVTCVPDDAK